jgi:hypothetical protein
MSAASYRVRGWLHPLLESTQVFYLYTALLELADAGEIELSWEATQHAADYAIVMELERCADSARRRVCFDIHDRSYLFFEPELKACDVYFKRSHFRPDVAKVPADLRAKIVPFGPIFGPGHHSSPTPLVMGWLRYALAHPRKAVTSFRHLTDFLRLPVTRDFERSPEHDMPAKVILQTRLWTESEVTAAPFAPEINEERVGVVRALRKALGDRFVGGALATPFAQKEFPDVVCHWDTRRSAYLKTMQTCLIGIYTKGLHHATAWKLGEYMAASMCVVASELRNDFAVPFTAPRNYLPFTSGEECAAQCLKLLDDREMARAMVRANHEYYREHVRPGRQLRRWLDHAFEATH